MRKLLIPLIGLVLLGALPMLACQSLTAPGARRSEAPTSRPPDKPTVAAPTAAPIPTPIPTPTRNTGDEPYRITGSFKVTNPFIQIDNAEPFVLLEDESGFVTRNRDYKFPPESQVLGSITIPEAGDWTYELLLPAKPQATFVDVDNNDQKDTGVQVFAIAYWINIWGDPFLEKRESGGWSTAYTSAKVDSERDDEIVGGKLLVWASDDQQKFPTGFGDDRKLFTKDDPVGPIPPGYSVVDLDASPFTFTKQPEPEITLYEGSIAVHDLSNLSYTEAFEQMWETVSREYPFTELKHLDWQKIHDEIAPRVAEAEKKKDPLAFYLAIRDFTWLIPDGHVGARGDDGGLFQSETAGGLGLAIRELDDGKVIATLVLNNDPAADAGVKVGAEILEFNGLPIAQAIGAVKPWSLPFSTRHTERLQQLRYLLRSVVGTEVEIKFQNPGAKAQTVKLTSVAERDSFSATSFFAGQDPLALPVEARLLESGIGYIKVNDLINDTNLIVRLWERAIRQFIENDAPGVIVDLRVNGGGSGLLAYDLPGYFVDKEVTLSQDYYYSEATGQFEPQGLPRKITPAGFQYTGPVVVLVGPACSSACEGMAYALQKSGRAKIVGQYPSGGLFGEVGAGQYQLPEGISLQVPTGRPVAPDGSIVIENVGVVPDVKVPVNEETVLSQDDVVLRAGEDALFGVGPGDLQIEGGPVIASAASSQTALGASAQFLDELATEKYDSSELSQARKTYTYTVSLDKDQRLFLENGWCATTQAILRDNYQHIALEFSVNGTPVDLKQFAVFDGPNGNQFCRIYYAMVFHWPKGTTTLEVKVTFDDKINDGTADYPKGTHVYKYVVTRP